mmetsp:Transcript_15830/g.29866  ORF Transcript_15830/g.29866 Transcript_15830/m.29866 type:complete len:212 (+) Transcript_15830:337-972(+)|eukprot:CAMPEP_0176503336 /NCGR_PEP_ID=MMETSP0200_2-20121128/15305_1 /TAXON_ID=947934 /ORGANISM="Chaetoceros sp., Strain GSL56" /LENGTH=211 /DNA_ID=CAMNT_0017902613 /DNA_START=315 /DNA_END=950 /DNA_ORIENTATION=-
MQRFNDSSRSILDTKSVSQLNRIRPKCNQAKALHNRSLLITEVGESEIYASANIDETGEYDHAMREWNVTIMSENHAMSCPLEALSKLQVRIGNDYISSFMKNRDSIIVRVFRLPYHSDEKSFSLTLGCDMVIIGRVRGWPRLHHSSPIECEDENEFHGSLEFLFQFLKENSYKGTHLVFGCIVFKDHILRPDNKRLVPIQEKVPNWETFE